MESLLNEQELNVDLPQAGAFVRCNWPALVPARSSSALAPNLKALCLSWIGSTVTEEREALQVGQEVHVLCFNPEVRMVTLSFRETRSEATLMGECREIAFERDVIESKIIGFNKGV